MAQANTDSTPKLGKCAQLHALWNEAGHGELLPRGFAVEMAIAQGFNPSTARTQFQRYYLKHQQSDTPLAE